MLILLYFRSWHLNSPRNIVRLVQFSTCFISGTFDLNLFININLNNLSLPLQIIGAQ